MGRIGERKNIADFFEGAWGSNFFKIIIILGICENDTRHDYSNFST